ncbi:MAG TPA: hypothetical protein VJR92_09455 [Gemmatimonadaceae bacterium]|nr:hypothetical protein [Gemmatimonadaceae bacterium]
MSGHEHDHDPVVEAAFARASRELAPSAGFTDRTIGALRDRALLRATPARVRRSLIAAAWFVAGVGTGVAAMELWRAASPANPLLAAVDANQPDFVEWY